MNEELTEKIMAVNREHAILLQDRRLPLPQNMQSKEILYWYRNMIFQLTEELNVIERRHEVKCICRKGCAHCCKQIIYISSWNNEILKSYLEIQPQRWKNRIFKKSQVILDKISKTDIPLMITADDAPDLNQIVRESNEKYFNLNLACPMLTNSRSCGMYFVRPISCWDYRCYGDKRDCKRHAFVDYSMIYPQADFVINEAFFRIFRTPQFPFYLLPFTIYKHLEVTESD